MKISPSASMAIAEMWSKMALDPTPSEKLKPFGPVVPATRTKPTLPPTETPFPMNWDAATYTEPAEFTTIPIGGVPAR